MSRSVPIRPGLGSRSGIRAVEPQQDDGSTRSRRPIEMIRCTYRPDGADFYCWKYGVWYNLMECCYRHDEQTFDGCTDCGQGSNNLKQHIHQYRSLYPRHRSSNGS